MNTQTSNRIFGILAGLLAAGMALSTVSAKPAVERTYPDFERKQRVIGPAGSTRLPDRLRPDAAPEQGHGVAHATSSASGASAARTRPGAQPVDRNDSDRAARLAAIDRDARMAARWAAAEVRRDGRRQLYRAGLFDGMREVFDGPGPDGFARAEGYSLGLTAPDARDEGLGFGRSEAELYAEQAAGEAVAGQFRDLDREPRFDPGFDLPRFSPPSLELAAPRLRDLFVEFPLADFSDRRMTNGWRFDARRLAACRSYDDFFDHGWDTPSAAFAMWKSNGGRAAPYTVLGLPAFRERFETVFLVEFSARLQEFFEEFGPRAYGRGLDAGWTYATFVQDELEFRRAFDEGFQAAFSRAAIVGFESRYSRAYDVAYEQAFNEWANEAKPEIGLVELIDADRDGIFEPGERVEAHFELVNYGGAGDNVALRLDGDVLAQPASKTVWLPARGVLQGVEPVTAPISVLTRSRTRTRLSFGMADRVAEVPLRVSYPVQIDRKSVRVLRDDLAGQVQVGLRMVNESRKPVQAEVRLAVPALADYVDGETVGMLAPGADTMVSFLVQDLDPLALMAGEVALEFEAFSGAKRQDELVQKLGDTVRNVENRDLLQYMLQLSHDPDASDRRIEQARELMLVRLREDWKVAVIRNGNPYKRDFKRDESHTALGDLVQSYRSEQDRIQCFDVFAGLGEEIHVLSTGLPGVHPFLRKYVRRLASRLP